jgi:hypothetical protein
MAPVVTAATATETSVETTGMSAMSGDMPCCPSEQKSKDCQDCPLLAICALKTSQAGPAWAASVTIRHAVRTFHAVLNDVLVDGVDRPPPDQPPRA